MSEEQEWLTVAEAARHLGIHPRQARRYADRLKDTEDIKEGQSPIRVRLSAIERLRDASPNASPPLIERNGHAPPESEDRDSDRGRTLKDSRDTIIALLERENALLREMLADRERGETELRELLLRQARRQDASEVRLLEAKDTGEDTGRTAEDSEGHSISNGGEDRGRTGKDRQGQPWWRRLFGRA